MVLQALQLLQSGFEGCEKKLEIDFTPTADLRRITKEQWDDILAEARCAIVSQRHNQHFQTYLLSESSLFVYPHKVMIKTCGTTGLLYILSKLLDFAKTLGTVPEFVQFSRSNFLFPAEQPFPHRSFETEVEYLNTFFPGAGYVLGPIDGPRWHFYIADMNLTKTSREQTLEMVMFDLPPSIMKVFHRRVLETEFPEAVERASSVVDHSKFGSSRMGAACTEASGIANLLPEADVDGFVFDPCGYSCNSLVNESYFTMHITPEPECSFVSFDTNLPVASYTSLVENILEMFRPGRFCIQVFVDDAAPAMHSDQSLSWNFEDYCCSDKTCHVFKGGYNVSGAHFVRTGSHDGADVKEHILSHVNSLDIPLDGAIFDALYKHVSVKRVARRQFEDVQELLFDIIGKQSTNDPFFLVDVSQVIKNLQQWVRSFPALKPFYHLKCNADPAILGILSALGCGFVCDSVPEISSATSVGIAAEQILFSRPFKSKAHLQSARDSCVGFVTVDSFPELEAVQKNCPKAQVLLRVVCPFSTEKAKFGIDAHHFSDFIAHAKKVGANLAGISCSISPESVKEGFFRPFLGFISKLVHEARSAGFNMSFLDISSEVCELSDLANPEFINYINDSIEELELGEITVLAHPSKLMVMNSHTLAVNVIAKRTVVKPEDSSDSYLYYVNDGLYGSFNCLLYEDQQVSPVPLLEEERSISTFPCTIFGPTCDGIDCISERSHLPKLEVGDWLYFPDMGAYTVSASTSFNGFGAPKSHYIYTV